MEPHLGTNPETLTKRELNIFNREAIWKNKLAVVRTTMWRIAPHHRNGALTDGEFQAQRGPAVVLPGQLVGFVQDDIVSGVSEATVHDSNSAIWFRQWPRQQD